jgi:hypothetical protein
VSTWIARLAGVLVLAAFHLFVVDAWAVTAPYFEDFETEATCTGTCQVACPLSTTGWLNSTTDGTDWTVDVAGTTSSPTGPSVDHTLGTSTGKYLYLEATSCFGTNLEGHLISPPLDLTFGNSPEARFWYHMYGQSMGTLHVDVLDASMSVLQLDIIPGFTDNVDLWQQTPIINLGTYVGQVVHIRIRGIIGSNFYSDMAVDDFSLVDPQPNDVGIQSIDAPVDGCGLGNEAITVTLGNFGTLPQSGFQIEYVVDGGLPITETYAGPIAGSSSDSFTFAALANLGASGSHSITVTTLLGADAVPSNDSLTVMVLNGQVVGSYPHVQDFDTLAGSQAWFSGGTASTWALGTPADSVINSAFSGTSSWVTGLSTDHANSESSFVRTLCGYDFSSLSSPALRLAIWWETFFSTDGAALQSSTDAGASWQTVGAFGDGSPNWYTDNTIDGNPGGQQHGWTGRSETSNGSGGWVYAIHDLSSLAGQSNVLFRIAFGSNSASVDEGVAFDDFEIFDNTSSELEITNLVLAPPLGSALPGATDVLALALELYATAGGGQDLSSVTVTNSGTIADAEIAAVKLYADDGDLTFDPSSDALLDTQAQSGGVATLNASGFTIPSITTRVVYVAFDLAGTASTGSTFGAEIAMPTTDIVAPGNPNITVINPPLLGPTLSVGGLVSTFPFFDDFSGLVPNRSVVFGAGSYPTATAVGTTVGNATTTNAALIELLTSFSSLAPVQGTHFAAIGFPNGEATGAIDYAFDLSAFNAATDPVWLQARWADNAEENDAEDFIFLSLDGGASWAAAIYDWDWTINNSTWNDLTIDLSDVLNTFSLNYTSDVIIRFQANDASALASGDGLLIDRVSLGRPMQTQVERPLGTVVAHLSSDNLGSIAATPQSLGYVLRNLGDLPLAVTGIGLASASNVSDESVTQPTITPIPSQTDDGFQVDFTPGIGPFSISVLIAVEEDPHFSGNVYAFTISGEGNEILPEIDVQRPAGMSIASGLSDDLGMVVTGMSDTLTYTIENLGFADLTVSGVSIESADSATASVSAQPTSPLAQGESTTFDVDYSADADGPFSFDVVIDNDDGDENPYVITVNGTAEGMGSGGAGGMGTGGMGVGGGPTSTSGAGPGAPPEEDGCGCRLPGGRRTPAPWTLAALALTLAALRRRRGSADRRLRGST